MSDAKVPSCSLFAERAHQYGPACAVVEHLNRGAPNRILVYYPLGSGKTLSALHAACTYLDNVRSCKKIVVMTTKSNVDTTWGEEIIRYYDHAPSVKTIDALSNASVHNVDWWMSSSHGRVQHYVRLMKLLCKATDMNMKDLMAKTPDALQALVDQKLPNIALTKREDLRVAKRTFRRRVRQKHQREKSFLKAIVPKRSFVMIVDESQQYLLSSAKRSIVRTLCNNAAFVILLSATPFNDVFTQMPGFRRLMGSANFSARVVYKHPTREHNVRQIQLAVRMTTEEYKEFARRDRMDDAYYSLGRPLCNTNSKWTAMWHQMNKDAAECVDNVCRIVVYSYFRPKGIDGFHSFLSGTSGNRSLHLGGKETSTMVLSDPEKATEWFARDDMPVKVLLISSKAQLGISLMGVQTFHLMEPQWSEQDEAQAIGRVTRHNSHVGLASNLVTVYHWYSVPDRSGRSLTADQKIRQLMMDKKRRTDAELRRLAHIGKNNLNKLLRAWKPN